MLLEARLDKARIPLQIDVGFGDVISPEALEVEYPTLLTFPAARLRAYPKESVVAEKFEAIVKLGIANSRMKDFYDLRVMAQRFEFRSSALSAALEATFAKRGTALPSLRQLAFTAEFAESPAKQTQWRAFLRRSGLEAKASLPELVKTLDEFVMPLVKGILNKRNILSLWRPVASAPSSVRAAKFRLAERLSVSQSPKPPIRATTRTTKHSEKPETSKALPVTYIL